MTSFIKAMEIQIESANKYVGDAASVERLYSNDMYALRVASIIHYAGHIDELIEYMQMPSDTVSS